MAVYTQLTTAQLQLLCEPFNLGEVVSFRGIEDGIENTTYFVDFSRNGEIEETVLTIFEYLSADDLPFFIELTTKLAERGLAVPCPYRTTEDNAVVHFEAKAALLFPRAEGGHVTQPTADQCGQAGEFLAAMHLSHVRPPSLHHVNTRGLGWMQRTAETIYQGLETAEQELVDQQFADHLQHLDSISSLPSGIVHADLFHDNALFHDGQLSAVIDFYFSATDVFLLDLALVANDWCWDEQRNDYDAQKLQQLISRYNAIRPITSQEQSLWWLVSRVAMMRFWLSRREDELQQTGRRLKSAYQLRRRLAQLIAHPSDIAQYC
ncbi:MAG: homoserine kinase [Pseudomonadales bacterium]|jgi:homoserine kinase type II